MHGGHPPLVDEQRVRDASEDEVPGSQRPRRRHQVRQRFVRGKDVALLLTNELVNDRVLQGARVDKGHVRVHFQRAIVPRTYFVEGVVVLAELAALEEIGAFGDLFVEDTGRERGLVSGLKNEKMAYLRRHLLEFSQVELVNHLPRRKHVDGGRFRDICSRTL